MSQTIRLKRSSTASKTLSDAPSYYTGEMGLNSTDEKLWIATTDRGASGDTADILEILTENNGLLLSETPVFTTDSVTSRTTDTDLTLSGNGTGNVKIDDDLIVTGDLTIQGTTTTINTATLEVEDKNIELGKVTTPTDTTADGGGITLKGDTDKTILWNNSTDSWDFNQNISSTGTITGSNLSGTNTGDENTLTGTVSGIVTAEGSADTSKFLNGSGAWSTPSTSVSYLKDIGDVYSSMSPTDGQVLTWDNTNSRWDADDASSGSADLTRTTYSYTATSGQTAFSVSYVTAAHVDVFLNGILLEQTDQYTLSGGDTATLTTGAQAGDIIVIYYWDSTVSRTVTELTATADQTTFTVSYENSIMSDVYVNGSLYTSDQYTLTGGSNLTFEAGLEAGDFVKFISWPAGITVVTSTTDADTLETHDGAYYLNWSNFTSTPTTISGYGITDAVVDFADLGITPTTFSGYGISDTITNLTDVQTSMSPTSGQIMTWDSGSSYWVASTFSIEDLSDVNTMTPTDGQVLTWDNTNSRWDAADTTASIEDLSDVNTMTPTDGQVLTWDNANSRWDAADSAGGDITKTDFTATANQTTFTVNYNTNDVEVFSSGVKMRNTEYTATNGTSIVLDNGVSAGTWIQVVTTN